MGRLRSAVPLYLALGSKEGQGTLGTQHAQGVRFVDYYYYYYYANFVRSHLLPFGARI